MGVSGGVGSLEGKAFWVKCTSLEVCEHLNDYELQIEHNVQEE